MRSTYIVAATVAGKRLVEQATQTPLPISAWKVTFYKRYALVKLGERKLQVHLLIVTEVIFAWKPIGRAKRDVANEVVQATDVAYPRHRCAA
jgi:hypothetical protein